jgi:hypothetical protein
MAKKEKLEKLEKSKAFDTCDEALRHIDKLLAVKNLTGRLHAHNETGQISYSWSVTWKEKA